MSGEEHPDLQIPEMPICLSHLVSLFSSIGEFSYSNIDHYQNVTGEKLALYEIETLQAMSKARDEGSHV